MMLCETNVCETDVIFFPKYAAQHRGSYLVKGIAFFPKYAAQHRGSYLVKGIAFYVLCRPLPPAWRSPRFC